ncbi:MAG: hypothetical protein CFE26_09590 [Verrucomicrobiales bacterium VVV1]|nr:MAG: hypothetical protein CFE26_09590 [Verrucomicrobiales bacterium VVV1]
MKRLTSMFSLGLLLMAAAGAVEPAKPLVTLSVKKQLLDSDHDMRGRQGSTQKKVYTLRVDVVNVSSSPIGESTLSGDALVARAMGEKEKIVKESLGTVKVPAMKPNEKLTLDLGKVSISEVEWRDRKFEEKLEEWKVLCKRNETEIGKAVSNERYETLSKDTETADPKGPGPLAPQRRKLRPFGK